MQAGNYHPDEMADGVRESESKQRAEKSAAIARACGWKFVEAPPPYEYEDSFWRSPDGKQHQYQPDYFTDPAACFEACNTLNYYYIVRRDRVALYDTRRGILLACCDVPETPVCARWAEAIFQTPKVQACVEREAENGNR